MRFSADWQDDAANAAPEERATVADFRLFLDGQNVCQHLTGNSASDHLTLPLYNLAEGLAHGWWTLFGGRDHELPLIRFRSGFAVPDIRLSFDGDSFRYAAGQRSYVNPDVRFWAGPVETIPRPQAEAELTTFIDTVLHRLNARRVNQTSAALRWARVQQSRGDPEEAEFCEAAGALQLDPYQLSEADAATIEAAAELFHGECLTEFLAGTVMVDRQHLIQWVKAADGRDPEKSAIPDLRDIAARVADAAPPRDNEPAWALGYRRARQLRHVLNLRPTERVKDYEDFARRLGAGTKFAPAPVINGICVLRTRTGDTMHLHMRRHGPKASQAYLFTFARGVGDAVCFPNDHRSPVNELRSAHRQAAGRACAAEFLAPVEELVAMRRDGYDIVSISEVFMVSTEVVERQLENLERIEWACRTEPVTTAGLSNQTA